MIRRRAISVVAAVSGMTMLLAACSTGTAANSAATDASGQEGLLAALRESGTMRVANTQVNPPFSFVDESGEVVGYDVDVAEEIAQRLGIDEVEYIVGTFQTFIPGLQSDKWDAVIAGLTITDERSEQVEFSCSYLVNEISAFVVPGSIDVESIRSEQDLVGKSVAVTAGGVQEQKVSEIDGVEVMTFDNATLALRDVATGRADLYVGAKFTGAYLAEMNDLDVEPVDAELGGLLSQEVTGMAFPKGQTELTAAANAALEEMIADGTLSELSKKWFGGLDVVDTLPDAEC